MDKLDHIFELQKGFQDKLKRERGGGEGRQDALGGAALAGGLPV